MWLESDDEDFFAVATEMPLEEIRESISIRGRRDYHYRNQLGNLNRLRRQDDLDRDFFLRIIFEVSKDYIEDASRLLKIFDFFVEDGEIFSDARSLISIFTNMFIHNDFLFYIIIASLIHRVTWRAIHDVAMSLYRRPDYEEILVVGLFSCLKLAPDVFTADEKTRMREIITQTFNVQQIPPMLPTNTERFIVYVRNTNAEGEIVDEEIGVADGDEITSAFVARVDTQRWNEVLSIVEMDPFEYNERQFSGEMTCGSEERVAFLEREMRARFERAKRILETKRRRCTREFTEFMLGMGPLDLPVYLNYEIAFFTLDCIRDGIITQFHAMQIVQRIVNVLRNARMRESVQVRRLH